MINVILANGISLVHEGLKEILKNHSDINILEESGTCSPIENKHKDSANNCDVAIVAHPLLHFSMNHLKDELLREWPNIKIIVVANHDSLHDVLSAIEIGARGLISENSVIKQLPFAIRAVFAGKLYINDEISALIANSFVTGAARSSPAKLSRREDEIFKRLIKGQRTSAIANGLGISMKTVSTHKRRILEKLAVKNVAELVHYAIENGLVEDGTF